MWTPSAVCSHAPDELGDALVGVLTAGRRSDGRGRRPDLDQATAVRRVLKVYEEHGAAAYG